MTGIEATTGLKVIGRILLKKFGAKVVERWTRHRAEKFFEGFLEVYSAEIKTNTESPETDATLEAILDDDIKSEVLWDAYRTVCFAKSKTLGPKVIGFLTGELVIEGRRANDVEEQVFQAAEMLSDGDLIELFKEFKKWAKESDACKDDKKEAHWKGNSLVIPWGDDSGSELDISMLNFKDVFDGYWAARAQQLRLLNSQIAYGQKKGFLEETTNVVKWTVVFEAPCRKLCELVERSLGAVQSPESGTNPKP